MKNKNIIYLVSVIIFILILIGLSLLTINWVSLNEFSQKKEPKGQSNQENINKYYVDKRNGFVFFNITQTKPTSCHIINFYKTEFEKEIILDLKITKYTNKCSSNNLVDKISGEIEIKDPESFEIRVDGKRVYFKEFN